MRQIMTQIASFFMAVLVLFSTFSFTVEQHFCGDLLVDTSFYGKAQSCGMEIQEDADDCNDMGIMCCSEELLTIEGQDELKISLDQLKFEQHQILVAFVFSYLDLFEDLPNNNNFLEDYPPPLLIRDFQVLHQTFLI